MIDVRTLMGIVGRNTRRQVRPYAWAARAVATGVIRAEGEGWQE